MTKEKKVTTLTIVEKVVQGLPIGVYGIFNIDDFYETTASGITITAIFVLATLLFYFKDMFKDGITKPSTFKFVAISGVLSLCFITIGDKIFVISSIILASFIASVPLDVGKQHLTKEDKEKELLTSLKKLLGK